MFSAPGTDSEVEQLPEWPPKIKPLAIVSGQGQIRLNIPGAERYCYWVRVQNGIFSQRHALMMDIEAWLLQNKMDCECDLDRYYFTQESDVTLFLLRWAW